MSMTPQKVAVGKKLVWPRKPYVPDDDQMVDFVGREEELQMAAAAWIGGPRSQPLSPLLVGPPGCGKNRLVYELARRMGLDLYVCQGYENITAEELACTLLPADEGNGRIDYLISTLATAMFKGGVCFIDEIGKFPGRALALLASVLDDRHYIDLDLIGERIHAHPQFRFVAATNSEDIEVLPGLRPLPPVSHHPGRAAGPGADQHHRPAPVPDPTAGHRRAVDGLLGAVGCGRG